MTGQPLDGIRVADFGQFIAGPAVGQILADLGARVVKVEPVGGEAARAAGDLGAAVIRTNNRDKLGLAVDLRRPEGREIALRLIAGSDVRHREHAARRHGPAWPWCRPVERGEPARRVPVDHRVRPGLGAISGRPGHRRAGRERDDVRDRRGRQRTAALGQVDAMTALPPRP